LVLDLNEFVDINSRGNGRVLLSTISVHTALVIRVTRWQSCCKNNYWSKPNSVLYVSGYPKCMKHFHGVYGGGGGIYH